MDGGPKGSNEVDGFGLELVSWGWDWLEESKWFLGGAFGPLAGVT